MLLALTALQCYADDYTFYVVDELVYKIHSEEDRTATVVRVDESCSPQFGGDKEIPQKVIINSKTYTVTAVGINAFENHSRLTSITIPNSVTSIGNYAFMNCSELSSITIPNSVETIGDYAFKSCSRLSSITIPDSVTSIGRSSFEYCVGFTSITIPNSVTSIGDYAFSGCSGLTSITIPNSVTSIRRSAFEYCDGLTSITIPNSVTSIGNSAFRGCSGLTSITIPNSVTSIGGYAFNNCSSLTTVTIPNSVKAIEISAFEGCPKLETIYMQCEVPIECKPNFSDDNLKNTILYIPKGTLAAYEKVDPWRNFWNIVEMDFSGVDEVAEDRGDAIRVENGRIVTEGDALTEVLDLQGRTVYRGYDRVVDNLARGLYVVRSGNNTVKIKL